ncbi:MAG: FHA domain-containing protein [Anaerolineae bacterium]|nr:FHA domain-containing protein [Anaerolineae bacterium]
MSHAIESKDGLFCLYCQHTNQWHATHCQQCGARLVAANSQLEAELKQQEESWTSGTHQAQFNKYLNSLPPGGLALFVSDRADPLTFPFVKNLILGRDAAHTGEQMVDVARLSQLGHSVSRRHAVILPATSGFTCSDLGSTNGTWLNLEMLEPGKPYPLQSGDQIRLGLLAMQVCFPVEDTAVKRLNILIKGRNTLEVHPHQLRPHYLLMHLSPFLQALNELQEIINLSQGQPPHDIQIHSIHERPAGIAIDLEIHPKTLHIWRTHISPWRDQYTEFANRDRKHPISFLEQAIEELSHQIFAALHTNTTKPSHSLPERLEAALTILAVSQLEAHWTG